MKIKYIIIIMIILGTMFTIYEYSANKKFIMNSSVYGTNPKETYEENFDEIKSICGTLLSQSEKVDYLYYKNNNIFPGLDGDFLDIKGFFVNINKEFLCRFKWKDNGYYFDVKHISDLEDIDSNLIGAQTIYRENVKGLQDMCSNTVIYKYNNLNGLSGGKNIKFNEYKSGFPEYDGVLLFLQGTLMVNNIKKFVCQFRYEGDDYRLINVNF